MPNPMRVMEKMLGGSTKNLAEVLESVHAHLEEILETDKKILNVMEDILRHTESINNKLNNDNK